MSYRHKSYRKMSRALREAAQAPPGATSASLTRAEMDRVMHWSNRPALPKPPGWGKPRKARS